MIVWQKNEWAHALLSQSSVYVIANLVGFVTYTVLVYNIRIHEADVMEVMIPAKFNFRPTWMSQHTSKVDNNKGEKHSVKK